MILLRCISCIVSFNDGYKHQLPTTKTCFHRSTNFWQLL